MKTDADACACGRTASDLTHDRAIGGFSQPFRSATYHPFLSASTEVALFDVHSEDGATEIWRGPLGEFLHSYRDLTAIEIANIATRKRCVIGVAPVTELRIAAEVVVTGAGRPIGAHE